MRIFLTSLILLFSFSLAFAQNKSDVEVRRSSGRPSPMTFGVYGQGYIPMETDKKLLGYGGGGGFKATYNINKYVGVGLSTGLTVATSNYNNNRNLTLLSDTRFSLIVQRETERGESGLVPWGSIGFGILAASGDYGSYQKLEDAIGFNFIASLGLRYNFSSAYLGIGAEYSVSRLYGNYISDYYYNGYYYTQRRTSVTMNPSGFNVFGEFGFRF